MPYSQANSFVLHRPELLDRAFHPVVGIAEAVTKLLAGSAAQWQDAAG